MDVKITKLPHSAVKMEVSEKWENIKKYFEKAYEDLAKDIDIKGFRKGKAPRLMTLEAIGMGRYNSTALDLALPEIYSEAVKMQKIVPVASPKINIKDFAEEHDFVFEAQVDVLPEIKLGDYKKIRIKHKSEPTDVKDEEIDKVIKRLMHQSAKYIVTGDGAKTGDRMEISFTGKVKGVQIDKYTSAHYPFILGEGVLLPEFEKQIIGLKKNDKKSFTQKIKSSQGEDTVNFDVEVNDVWHVDLPKLNDEFAKKFGHTSVKDLWDAIGKSIKMEKEQKDRQVVEEKVFDQMLKIAQIDVPESMIDQETTNRLDHIKKQMGVTFDKFLENQKKSVADLQKEIRPAAERGVKISLILSQTAKELGFFDAKKLGKDMVKNQEYQRDAMKKTMDELVKITSSK